MTAEPKQRGSTSGDVTSTQVRSSTVLLVGQAFAVGVNLVTQILLVRYLSKASFGTFAYALSIVALGETVSAFGLRRGISRFVPMYEERHELEKAAGALVLAFSTVLGLGLTVALIVIGLRTTIGDELSSGTDAAVLLAVLIFLAPVHALEGLLDGTFAVFVRPRAIFFRRFVYAPLVRLFVVGLLVATGAGILFLGIGYVLAGLVGLLVYSALLLPVLRQHDLLGRIRTRRLVFPVRELMGFTTPLLTNDVASALLASLGPILLGVMAGADDVAELRAVLPISLTLTYVLTAFGTLFVPLAARLYARDEQDEVNRLYWQTAAWTALFSFPVFAVAFAFGEQVVTLLFGERYASSGPILAALVVGHFVTAATGPNGTLLSVFGKVRYIVWTNVFAVTVHLLIVFALIQALGALGAALAASTTLVLLNSVRQVGIAKRTPVRAIDWHYIPLYAALVLATVFLVLVDVVLEPPLAVAIVLVAVVSLVVLVFARRRLALAQTFPELGRIPGLGRFLSPSEWRP